MECVKSLDKRVFVRELYEWFGKLCQKNQLQCLATEKNCKFIYPLFFILCESLVQTAGFLMIQ